MLKPVWMCSGPPWFRFEGKLPPCGNVAQVESDRGRPMCVDCADAADRNARRNKISRPLFSEFRR